LYRLPRAARIWTGRERGEGGGGRRRGAEREEDLLMLIIDDDDGDEERTRGDVDACMYICTLRSLSYIRGERQEIGISGA
jgi:hypothetical protein